MASPGSPSGLDEHERHEEPPRAARSSPPSPPPNVQWLHLRGFAGRTVEHGRSVWRSLRRRHRRGKRWIRSPYRRERRLPGRPRYPAERQTPSGTDSILRLNATASSPARTDPGDLLVFPSGRQRLALLTSAPRYQRERAGLLRIAGADPCTRPMRSREAPSGASGVCTDCPPRARRHVSAPALRERRGADLTTCGKQTHVVVPRSARQRPREARRRRANRGARWPSGTCAS